MAGTSQELTVRVTTDADQAKRDLAALEKTGKELEKGVDVPLKLTGGDKAASQLQQTASAAKDLQQAIGGVDGIHVRDIDGPARIAAAAMQKVKEEAEAAAKAVQDVGGGQGGENLRRVKPAADEASEAMKSTVRAADGTKNAFANLVGNTAQDLSGLGGAFSSIGVAIGQVAEFTTDAANEGGGLGAALAGAASMAGPMIALAGAAFLVQKVLGDSRKRAEEAKAANEAYASSLEKVVPLTEDWVKSLQGAFDQGTLDRAGDFNLFMANTLKTLGELDTATAALGRLGLKSTDLGKAIGDADTSWQDWSRSLIPSLGLSDQASTKLSELIGHARSMKDLQSQIGASGKGTFSDMVTDDQLARVKLYVSGIGDIRDIVKKLNTESKATDFNDTARGFSEFVDIVDKGRAAGESERDIALDVAQAYQTQAGARDEAKRAAEEGAAAAQAAGSIQEQVARQVAEAEQAVADAADEAKAAQDNWLTQNVKYEGQVDGFTESLQKLTDQTQKQAKAGDEGAGSFEGNTKAALDNRDALRNVYEKATDVIQGMKDAGFSVDGARQAQDNMAQSAYDLAIQMGFPIEKAQEIKDKIDQIPPSVTTDVAITEQGYDNVKAKKDDLDQDMESTLYINGVLDRSVLDAVAELPPGAFGRSVVPSSAVQPASTAVVPAAGLLGVEGAIPAPVARPALLGASRTSSTSVVMPVTVNVNAGIVADTFQLQRAVVRAGRGFQRLAGKRATG